jgi:hypothetical protein
MPFPDGLDSPHNVTVLYRFAFWDRIGPLSIPLKGQ